MTSPTASDMPDFLGELNFQAETATRNLTTDGSRYAIIDPLTGGFKSFNGLDDVSVTVPIYNARDTGKTLDENGFELVTHPFPSDVNFGSDDAIVRDYYPLVAEFMRAHTGAHKAYAFDHYRRSTNATMAYAVEAGQKIGGAAVKVHCDYALEGAPKRRDGFGLPPAHDDAFRGVYGDRPLIPPVELAALAGRRFALVNLWRSIAPAGEPLVDMPLAFCDTRTTSAADFGTVEFRYVDRTIETYLGFHAPAQRWYYYPGMLRDEAVLLKTFDSQGDIARDFAAGTGGAYPHFDQRRPAVPSTFTLHSAVRDPRLAAAADFPKRQSVEVRCILFF